MIDHKMPINKAVSAPRVHSSGCPTSCAWNR
ncbi:hypothetical protein [Pyramidobacter sp.]|nr:hypothetical protein [Pyramidobacter sp.]MCI7403760.1 hypothetical protein [Pyramidobacter sp.]MDY3212691.1 hypothetical protein [Pyramidobacter sp.]